MGVPGLFYYIKSHFRYSVKRFIFGEFTTKIDYLYLDANGLLHDASQYIFKYGKYENKDEPKPVFFSYEYAIQLVFELFFKNLLKVLSIVVPQKILYIAIDGPAPRAKKNQQRQRRYEAVITSDMFTSNSITPGTEFMFELTKYINFAIRKLLESFNNIKIIFSPPSVPGEGEHKIMDYIRSLEGDELKNKSHCMFGPDADLIMLTLAAHIPNIFLLKEDQIDGDNQYYYLNMGKIRYDLPKILKIKTAENFDRRGQVVRTLDEISDDFIIAGFFVGNDFLPRLKMFLMLDDGLSCILNTYMTTSDNGYKNPLTIKGKMCYKGFKALISELEKKEMQYLIDQITTKDPRKQPPEDKFKNKLLLKYIVEEGTADQTKYHLKFIDYAKAYYTNAGIAHSQVAHVCRDYIKSFAWILEYYVSGIPSWNWSYNYHYAPLVYNLKKTLEQLTETEFNELCKFDIGKPSLPFEQLIAVLPPRSSNLLPTEYEILFEDDSLMGKEGYFPKKVEKDYEGKLREHEAHIFVPFVNPNIVELAYESIKTKEYVRNKFGNNVMYHFDDKYTATYRSAYGNIPMMHVRKSII